MSSNEKSNEKSSEGAAELSGNNTYYPPPPAGPPPQTGPSQQTWSHSEQHQDQQHQDDHHQQPPAQQYAPPSQQPYFPPPPPAPTDEKQSQHQQAAIPAYNPANPVFAPPPTDQAPAPSSHQQSPQPQPQPQPQQAHKKPGWGDRFKHFVSAGAAAPINSLAHKLGSQSFLPETLDKECDKSAAILRSFCTKGVYADPSAGQPPTSTDPKAQASSSGVIDPTKEKPKNRVIVTIPPKVISKALGLAIFTTFRAGFQISGATGSGILVARLPDGSWSPPSGIQVHSVGGGFQIGLDIYDCVCVINTREALAAFMNTRVSLGSDLAVVAGPYGAGGAVDFGTAVPRERGRDDKDKKATATSSAPGDAQVPTGKAAAQDQDANTLQPHAGASQDSKPRSRSSTTSAFKPVFSYVKSRGFYAGIQVDGTVVVERKDANASFYGAPLTVQQILHGQVPSQGPQGMWPVGARGLLETLRGAEAGALGDASLASTSASASASGPALPPGPVNVPSASAPPPAGAVPDEASSGAPPAYVDDGSHAHVGGDVKYA